jgi:hypothetical protein
MKPREFIGIVWRRRLARARPTKGAVVMHYSFLCRLVAACWIFGIAAGSADLAAQQAIQVTKEQLVGTWKLVSWEQFEPNGSTSPALVGTNIAGMLMFDTAGNFSLQMISERPKWVAEGRMSGTPEENAAAAQGVLSYFGTYSVAPNGLVFHIERSSFPNLAGVSARRVLMSFTGDVMKYQNAATGRGGQAHIEWKRVK